MVYLVRVFPIGGTDKVMKNCAKVPDACNKAVASPSTFCSKRWGSALGILPLCTLVSILLAPRLCEGGGSNLYWSVKQPI